MFLDHLFSSKRASLFWTTFFALLVTLFFAYRLHNTWVFNPYWGYDGGGHIDYFFSLATKFHFPSIEKNYIAWHEPFYYLLNTPVLIVGRWITQDLALQLKTLGVAQVIWSFVTLWTLYRASRLLLSRGWAILPVLLFSALPAFHEASTFLTNELFSYLFAFLILEFFWRRVWTDGFKRHDGWYLGILMGLGLLSKITVIIPVALTLIACLFLAWKRFPGIRFSFFAAIGFSIIALNFPWQIYRYNHIAQGPTLNNPQYLKPAPLSGKQLKDVLFSFDPELFQMPYWPVGNAKFPAMLYGDFVSDYYGSLENDEFLDATPKEQLVQTARSSWVTPRHAWYAKKLIWLGIPIVILLLLGLFTMIEDIFFTSQKTRWLGVYALFSFGGYLAAQVFYVWRYPFFDMGAVKAIFILPGFFFPILYGFRGLSDAREFLVTKILAYIFVLILTIYVGVSYVAFFLPRFHY